MADQPLDPPEPGPSAALVRAMLDDGVDLSDETAVTAWIDDLNTRPFDDRAQVLTGRRRSVAPIALPNAAELVDAVRRSPTMVQLADFVDWISDGRALTREGELRLVDGKDLVDVLDTGDRVDPVFRGRVFETRSTQELRGVDAVFRLALSSGLARRHKSRLVRTERGSVLLQPARFAGEAPRIWRDVVRALLDLGAVSGGVGDNADLVWWEAFLDAGVTDLLCTFAVTGTGMWADGVVSTAIDDVIGAHDILSLPDAHRVMLPESVAHSVVHLVERLLGLGLLSCEVRAMPTDCWSDGEPVGSWIDLTLLGNWFVRPLLIGRGFAVPVFGQHVGTSADGLIDAIASWRPDPFATEVRLWAGARSEPADELVAAAVAASSLDRRRIVFQALDALGERAIPAVRTAVALPILRPFAVGWLMEYDAEPSDALEVTDDPRTLVETLAVILVTLGPDAMCTMQNGHGAGDAELATIEGLWRVNDPYVGPVLEALGRHRIKPVAKAARRALFKLRNLS